MFTVYMVFLVIMESLIVRVKLDYEYSRVVSINMLSFTEKLLNSME